ncbi:MAG TPA: lytic transglycosylase domain-containing protein [Desulfobacteraceae bacterium]|nr:lytic transglycosylase domain-containing protein [Desulfobacteraceae bacterium]
MNIPAKGSSPLNSHAGKGICVIIALFSAIIFFSNPAFSETASLPVTIDYQLLRSLIIKTAYTDSNQEAVLVYENEGCRQVVISEPLFCEENEQIAFETKVRIRSGLYLFENCRVPIEWEGYLKLIQKPRIDHKWVLSFETLDSAIYDSEHRPAEIAGFIWSLVKTRVYEYLESIRINLAPPVADLKSFLEPLFLPDFKDSSQKMIDSMRPGVLTVNSKALKIDILADVEESAEETVYEEQEMLSEEKLARFTDNWETWDSFLVTIITSLAKEPLSAEDRHILLDTLLETRYRFIKELQQERTEKDFVREQFTASWKRLSPVFRNHLSNEPSRAILGYLAFFTAADALSVLDSLGPSLGIEISRNGLVRLARMLSEGESVPLDYFTGINTQLRETLGLGAPPECRAPSFEGEELDIDSEDSEADENEQDLLSLILEYFLCKPAFAGGNDSTVDLNKLRPWIFKKSDMMSYLERVKGLIEEVSLSTLEKGLIDKEYHSLYQKAVFATAWQESCFRQFRVKNGKLSYLRSYNNTSVGLMQINERVWRGMYDVNHLRWDIRYNTTAGCEIFELYLRNYALRRIKENRVKEPLDNDTLARLVYAMYNEGPAAFFSFLKRREMNKYYLSDDLFREKYEWVKDDQWENIRLCLIGG